MSYKNVQSKFRGQDNDDTNTKKQLRLHLLSQLIKSAQNNDLDLFKQYLTQDFSLLNEEISSNITDGQVYTLFRKVCVATTNMDIIKFCLENNADPNFQKKSSLTPFFCFCNRTDFSIIWKQSGVLQLFFQYGADPNIKCTDEAGLTNPFGAIFFTLQWIVLPVNRLSMKHIIHAIPDNLPQIVELFLNNKAELTFMLYEKMSVQDHLKTLCSYIISNSLILEEITGKGFTILFIIKYTEIMQKLAGTQVKPLINNIDPNQQKQQNVKAVNNLLLTSKKVKFLLLSNKSPATSHKVKTNEKVSQDCKSIVKWQPGMFTMPEEQEMVEFEERQPDQNFHISRDYLHVLLEHLEDHSSMVGLRKHI